MRTAQMKVKNIGEDKSVVITLHWAWLGPGKSLGRWYCLPGYLPGSSGYWEDHPLSRRIYLYDDDDNRVGWTSTMNLDWIGYPLSELEGDSGPFFAERRGVIHEFAQWEMLSV